MDSGGIWPGDESYFQNIRETALQDTIEQLTKELAEARAEIERKDKLIEQMREALHLADDLIDEYAADYEHRDNVDEIRDEIKAALAAERLEE